MSQSEDGKGERAVGAMGAWLRSMLPMLLLFVSAIAWAVKADQNASAACIQSRELEIRMRANEKAVADMAGDIKVVRALLERADQGGRKAP